MEFYKEIKHYPKICMKPKKTPKKQKPKETPNSQSNLEKEEQS